jgi:pyranose oxidase
MEAMLDTNDTSFDDSIRQQLVKYTLAKAYEEVRRENGETFSRQIKSMPLACERKNKDYVQWSCSATILGKELSDPKYEGDDFEIRPNTQCVRLVRSDLDGTIQWALVEDLMEGKKYRIKANKYVICAGAVLTPGILFNSEFRRDTLPALVCPGRASPLGVKANEQLTRTCYQGRYMTEQPMAFCQIVLSRKLVDKVKKNPSDPEWEEFVREYEEAHPNDQKFEDLVRDHEEAHPNDPLPFPFNDPDPQCYFPLSEDYPWHTQIHRDAFGYGQVPATIDQRVVVDLRWFGYVKPEKTNYVDFTTDYKDEFGMPQVSGVT